MNIAILADLHLGYKKSSQLYWDYFLKFFDDVFIPYIESNNIDTIIQLGDFFDNRKSLDLDTLYNTKKLILDRLKNKNIHILVGNHDVFHKDSNHINSPSLVLGEYKNIKIYDTCTTINTAGRTIDLIPWINSSNYENTINFIKNSKSSIACSHLEVNGATLMPGHTLNHGTDPNLFSNYKKVLSGHIHFRSIYQNIHYIGIPYELNFGDEDALRGFTILDTETLKTKFVKNPYQLYKTVYYDDNTVIDDFQKYTDCIVKVVCKQIKSEENFNNFINALQLLAYSVKIIESEYKLINTNNFTDDTILNSSTLELFEDYLSGTNIKEKSEDIMKIIKNIYYKLSS